MQLYNCKVRLHGSLLHEVPLSDVTASEIAVLRVVHRDDAVVDIKHTGHEIDRSDSEERARLNMQYASALSTIENVKSLNGIFGVMGALPQMLPEVTHVKAAIARKAGRHGKTDAPQLATPDLNLASDEDISVPDLEDELA